MSADAPDDTTPPPCSACRGTGQVISRLGGEDHSVTCPWCEGGGKRIPGHDAQARGGVEKPDGNGGDGGPDLAA
jgi:DnaJ-class molecular chaperone